MVRKRSITQKYTGDSSTKRWGRGEQRKGDSAGGTVAPRKAQLTKTIRA